MKTWVKATIAVPVAAAAIGGWYLFGAHPERPEAVMVEQVNVLTHAVELKGDLSNSSRNYRRVVARQDDERLFFTVYTSLIPPWPTDGTGAFAVTYTPDDRIARIDEVYLEGRGAGPLRLIWKRP